MSQTIDLVPKKGVVAFHPRRLDVHMRNAALAFIPTCVIVVMPVEKGLST